MQETTIKIRGMSCGHCVTAVRGALSNLPGVDVQDVKVGSARVSYDPVQVSPQRLAEAIREEGYETVGSEG